MNEMTPVMKWIFRFGAAAALVLVFLFYLASTSNEVVTQPIVYSHKIHIEAAGLTCTDCHSSVESSAAASIPNLEICSTCHSEEPLSQSPEELKLLDFVKEGKAIPWERVYHVPDHVYFSHRRHVTKAGLECTTCHGNIPEFTSPVSSQFLPMTMNNCMNCHRKNNVSNDCLACHR